MYHHPIQLPWSRANALLLIESYKQLKEKFCNPKVKNKDVWGDIRLQFYKRGLVVTADQLDRKFRKTYKTVNDNNKNRLDMDMFLGNITATYK